MARASSYLIPSSSYLTVGTSPRTNTSGCGPHSLYTAAEHSSPSHSTDPSEAGSRQGVVSPPPPFRLSSSMNNGPNTSELSPHLVQRHRLRENVGEVVLARHLAQSEPAFPDGLLDPQNSRLYVPEFSHARSIRDGSCSAGVDISHPRSRANAWMPIPSQAAFTKARYSASPLERATVACVKLQCFIADPPMVTTHPDVDRRVRTHPAQSESENTSMVHSSLLNVHESRGNWSKYRTNRFNFLQAARVGAAVCRQASFAANWMSALSCER